jgi:cytochrome c oxidase assembly protein subunit 15
VRVVQSGLAVSVDSGPGAGSPPTIAGFRRLVVAAIGVSLVLIAIGGTVRATDSGLACPDWPACYGRWIPPADLHMWIEHTHRLVAGVLLMLVWVLTLWTLRRFRDRRELLLPVLGAWILVHAQALLGALVVWNLLKAELVTAHLGMAMAVLGCLILLAVNVTRPPVRGAAWTGLQRNAAAAAALAYVQILVGGHVTGIGASLVFTDFPTMGGTMLPRIGTEQEAYHVLHRALAFALFFAVVWLAARVVRAHRADAWGEEQRWVVKLPMWAATLIVVQIGLGVANLATRASYVTVTPHLAVASWIWAVLLLGALLTRRLTGEQSA